MLGTVALCDTALVCASGSAATVIPTIVLVQASNGVLGQRYHYRGLRRRQHSSNLTSRVMGK